MASSRLSFFLLFLVTTLQVLAAGTIASPDLDYEDIGTNVPSLAGGYWYQEIIPSTATSATPAQVSAAAKAAYSNMAEKADDANLGVPATAAAFFIPGKGFILTTSIKTGARAQSVQTCQIVQDGDHRNYANCAEINALAIALNKAWSIPATGAMMAVYGTTTSSATPRFLHPCNQDEEGWKGCSNILAGSKYRNIQVLKRLESSSRADDGFIAKKFVS